MVRSYSLAICGAGPAGIGFLFASLKERHLDYYIDNGLLVIDKNYTLGAGDLKKYFIRSNTSASTFVELIDDHKSLNIFSFSKSEKKFINQIRELDNEPIDLPKVGQFLELITTKILEYIILKGGTVIKGANIYQLKKSKNSWDILYSKQKSNYKLLARNLILNFGCRQHKESIIQELKQTLDIFNNKSLLNKIVVSNDVIGQPIEQVRSNVLLKKDIVVIGSSHSAFSVLQILSDCTSINQKITLVFRSKVKIFYPNLALAKKDNYIYDHNKDICPATGWVNRFGGLRFDAKRIAIKYLKNEKFILGQFESFSMANADDRNPLNASIMNSSGIIPCFGHSTNIPPILNKDDNSLVALKYKNQFDVQVDDLGRLYDNNSNIISGIYTFGIGSNIPIDPAIGGEASFNKSVDGVWLYHNDIGRKIAKNIRLD